MTLEEIGRFVTDKEATRYSKWLNQIGKTKRRIGQSALDYTLGQGYNTVSYLTRFVQTVTSRDLWRAASTMTRDRSAEHAQIAVDMLVLLGLEYPEGLDDATRWIANGGGDRLAGWAPRRDSIQRRRAFQLLLQDTTGDKTDRYFSNLQAASLTTVFPLVAAHPGWTDSVDELAFQSARLGETKDDFVQTIRSLRRAARQRNQPLTMIYGCAILSAFASTTQSNQGLARFREQIALPRSFSYAFFDTMLTCQPDRWNRLFELSPSALTETTGIDLTQPAIPPSIVYRAMIDDLPRPFGNNKLTMVLFRSCSVSNRSTRPWHRWKRLVAFAGLTLGSRYLQDRITALMLWGLIDERISGKASVSFEIPEREVYRAVDGVLDQRTTGNPDERYRKICRAIVMHDWSRRVQERSLPFVNIAKMGRIAETTGAWDAIHHALDVLPPSLMPKYLAWCQQSGTDSETTDYSPRAYCRIPFSAAVVPIREAVVPLVGMVPIYPADWASTDGTFIRLPHVIDYFYDDPDVHEDNRNVTMYAYLALHEAGHIIGASFRYDIRPYMRTKRYPDLFFQIYNYVEDFRIERVLRSYVLHPQTIDILDFGQRFFIWDVEQIGPRAIFLNHLMDVLWLRGERYRNDLDWRRSVDELLKDRRIGREIAAILKELISLDYENPLAAIAISEHLYRIAIAWFDPEQKESSGPQPTDDQSEYGEGDGSGERIPITPENVDALYTAANIAPDAFVNEMDEQTYIAMLEGVPSSIDEQEGFLDDMRQTAADLRSAQIRKNDTTEAYRNAQEQANKKKDRTRKQTKGKKKNTRAHTTPAKKTAPRRGAEEDVNAVIETELSTVDRRFLRAHQRYAHIKRQIEESLRALVRRQTDSEREHCDYGLEIDTEALVNIIADYNRCRDEPLFLQPRTEGIDASVYVGIDVSGSTASFVDDLSGSTDRTTVIDIEKHFALLFYDALEEIGIQPKIAAFESMTGTNVYWVANRDAISGLTPGQANRDGAFIRHMAGIIEQESAVQKFFFLISDGRPSALNYEGEAAIEDTRSAITEAVERGVQVMYINVDEPTNPYFDTFANAASGAIQCRSPLDLPALVPTLVEHVFHSYN